MPLYRCIKCGCVENTATGDYWTKIDAPFCSECSTGEWHGRFPKKSAKGMLIDQNGHLWSQAQVDAGDLPAHYRIVGKVES